MTLLIRNAEIIGGAREFPERSDIFVANEKISAIGSFPKKTADTVIDAQGAYVSPGFIDIDTSSDHYLTLFEHPEQEDFLRQGVTTIFGGMCGASLAPLLYGTLDSLRKWEDPHRVNVNWHTMAELLDAITKRRLAVNFGTLAGHTTVRRDIIGNTLRDLTKNELAVLSETLKHAMDDGGFGISTGLGYVHARRTPYPELRLLADVVKNMNGVYATHLRNSTNDIRASVDETIKLAKETGARAVISHFTPIIGNEKEYEAALASIEGLPDEIDLHFDICPATSSLIPLYMFLPLWTQTGDMDVMLANIKDEWLQSRIKSDMEVPDENNFVVAQAQGNDFLIGKSLATIKNMYGATDTRDALMRLMLATNLKGVALTKNLDENLIAQAMRSKRSIISSNAPSFGPEGRYRRLKTERTTSTFPAYLSFTEKNNIPIEEAIRKVTSEPAKLFDIALRGEIKEGNFADLACFRDGEVKFTIVNGEVAFNGGEFQKKFAGKALRHMPGK